MALFSPNPHAPRRRSTASEQSRWLAALTAIAVVAASCLSVRARAAALEPVTLVVVERSIVQDQGGWQVDYRLRHEGPTEIVAAPAEIQAKLEGWVSNSRIANHAVPRLSSLSILGQAGWSSTSEVIASADDHQRCRERLVLQIWANDELDSPPITAAKPAVESSEHPAQPLLSLAPGAVMRVRLRLEHLHALYGDYDPLLSQRTVELHLGSAVLRDLIPMEREQYLALPKATWPAPPEDRRDTRHFISGPDSLHLEAHVPGNEHYKFAERPVRYATKMRLKYWYLIASGTDGGCRVRITQYKETPTVYKPLYDAAQEECMTKVGRWTKVERIFHTDREATSLALEFRLTDPNNTRIGEVWIDDVSLEPVLAGPTGP
ncbi:hypothetical protein SAMN05444166_4360 [Singulisphaera sp. GP187]|uniref:hypothetical protein n=1 Tax=Singulisphaera sp. GP187 TaxID=1882752 RepID=UPI0009284FD2|nr:hypothetical protein [Singulisphaera sp. GP187]SIO39711.1 hypothetical protein SAMN05444166_4360 [Singulisphaera sp. GP187]